MAGQQRGEGPRLPSPDAEEGLGVLWGCTAGTSGTAVGRDAGGQVCSPLQAIPKGWCQQCCPGCWHPVHSALGAAPLPVSHVPPEPPPITGTAAKPRESPQRETGNYREPPPPDVTSLPPQRCVETGSSDPISTEVPHELQRGSSWCK